MQISTIQKINNILLVFTLASISLISGCASLVNGGHQQLRIDTIDAITGANTSAECRISNATLNLTVKSAETIQIDRSSDELVIKCEDGASVGEISQDSDFLQRYLLADLATDFCIVSCFVDGALGSWNEYPSPVVVPMHQR